MLGFFLKTYLDFSTGLSFSLGPSFFVLGLEYSSFTFPGFTVLPFFFIGSCKKGWMLKENPRKPSAVLRLCIFALSTSLTLVSTSGLEVSVVVEELSSLSARLSLPPSP